MIEAWKQIPDHHYEVSDLSRVRNTETGRILRGSPHEFGYRSIGLWKNNRPDFQTIHKLVLEAFVGPCPPGLECRHGNGVPDDNRLTNLSWGTHKENIADKKLHGTFNLPPVGATRKLSWETLTAMRAETGLSQRQLARKYNLPQASVWYWLRKDKSDVKATG